MKTFEDFWLAVQLGDTIPVDEYITDVDYLDGQYPLPLAA